MNSTNQLRQKLSELLQRHIRDEDSELSEDAFVRIVMKRYEKEREAYLVDPNE